MEKKVIFVHGYTSSPKKTKYQLIAKKLQTLGIDYSIPQMPGGEYPHSKDWLEIINREVNDSKDPVVLVGHSLGTRAILLYLNKYHQKVDTVVLISPSDQKSKEKVKGNMADFYNVNLNFEKIKNLAGKFLVVHSKDDDTLPYEGGVGISKKLDSEFISYDNMGHFSGEENAERNATAFVEIVKSVI